MQDFNPVVDLSRVHKREAVTINWKTGIETAIFLNYSTADQQNELVHYETDPVYYINWIGWVFNKISPWYKRFNGMIEKYGKIRILCRYVDHPFLLS